jgi:hypothetical protein
MGSLNFKLKTEIVAEIKILTEHFAEIKTRNPNRNQNSKSNYQAQFTKLLFRFFPTEIT